MVLGSKFIKKSTTHVASDDLQYGVDKYGFVDLPHISGGNSDASVIALQELKHYFETTGLNDQAALFAAFFPYHYWIYDLDDAEYEILVDRLKEYGRLAASISSTPPATSDLIRNLKLMVVDGNAFNSDHKLTHLKFALYLA